MSKPVYLHVSDESANQHIQAKNISEIYSHKLPFPLALQTTPKSQVEEPARSGKERDPDTVCDAARDLFLWSVLQNQKDLAQITWEQVLI